MIPSLFTNRVAERDFISDALRHYATRTSYVYIASAFFTDDSLIRDISKNKGRVRIVVRLDFPTDPKALRSILGLPGVEIRYFTNSAFHPKLYIFGDQVALVGSANLTKSALLTNQEIMVSILSDNERFEKLVFLFDEYWHDSRVLNSDVITKYETICRKYDALTTDYYKMGDDIKTLLGDIVSQNINREVQKRSQEDTFIGPFTQSYQECVTAFNIIKTIYEDIGKRKFPEEQIPLRIEIDQFINFVREEHARGDTWQETDILAGQEQENIIRELITEWHSIEWQYLTKVIVAQNWPKLCRVFSSAKLVERADNDSLFEALSVLHSFSETKRFKLGGTLKEIFFRDNDSTKIRNSLSYLLFGKDEAIRRMYNVIFINSFKLRWFGRSSVQEMVGWVNQDNYPIINGRTTKILRFLGFDVVQL